MNKIIEPRTLPGFLELLPQDQIIFNQIKKIIQDNYEKAGFLPIDTPAIEFSEVLLAKAGGETEKQIYRFMKGETDLSLRFDLTVPLAKYVAKNYHDITFPFRRYQIGKVYRGERVQRGRYREFYQCDIDVIGDGELSISNDAEVASIIYHIFSELDFGKFTIKINNRKVLTGFLNSLGLSEKTTEVLRIIDKIEKVGKDILMEMFDDLSIAKDTANKILEFITTKDDVLSYLNSLSIEDDTFKAGLQELETVAKYMQLFGIPKDYYIVDLSIARGLDYYTGTVYETVIDAYPEIGSVCSGGRYENLAEYYTKQKLPGVGISIGLTRLFYILNEYKLLRLSSKKSISDVIVIPMLEDLSYPINIVNILRNNGICTELYMENKNIKKKMNYANKLDVPYAVIIGEDEYKTNTISLKNMQTGEQENMALEELLLRFKKG